MTGIAPATTDLPITMRRAEPPEPFERTIELVQQGFVKISED